MGLSHEGEIRILSKAEQVAYQVGAASGLTAGISEAFAFFGGEVFKVRPETVNILNYIALGTFSFALVNLAIISVIDKRIQTLKGSNGN